MSNLSWCHINFESTFDLDTTRTATPIPRCVHGSDPGLQLTLSRQMSAFSCDDKHDVGQRVALSSPRSSGDPQFRARTRGGCPRLVCCRFGVRCSVDDLCSGQSRADPGRNGNILLGARNSGSLIVSDWRDRKWRNMDTPSPSLPLHLSPSVSLSLSLHLPFSVRSLPPSVCASLPPAPSLSASLPLSGRSNHASGR